MNLRELIKNNLIELIFLFISFFLYVIFIYKYLSTEVLFLASFQGDIQLVEKYFSGLLSINDFFSKFGEHGMFGYNLLLLFNAKFLGYNSHFDMYINMINVFLISTILLFSFINSIEKKDYLYYLAVILIIFFSFNTMQSTSATMETQVRLGFMLFVVSSFFLDRSIYTNKYNKTFYISIISIILSINIFGTIYNFASYPVIFLVLLYVWFFKSNKVAKIFLIVYLLAFIVYTIEYPASVSDQNVNNRLITSAVFWLNNLDKLFNSICAYYGSATLGYPTYIDNVISKENYLRVGYIIFSINIIATFLYFKSKMYNKTYLPIFLQGYTIMVIILALLGRYEIAGWEWGINNWYHVHTKVGLIATIWIFYYARNTIKNNFKKYINILTIVSFIILFISIYFGTRNDLKRAPYVKAWYENFQKWMYADVDDMPIDANGLTPLLLPYDTTKDSLEILRKYNLSVFRNINYPQKLDSTTRLLKGNFYSDSWVSSHLKMKMNIKNGKLMAKIYFPNKNFIPNKIALVEIKFDKSIIPKNIGLNNGIRELSAIINQFYFK